MSTVAVTRLIDAPAVRVWRVFTDLPARAAWLSTVDAIEVMTPGLFGLGTVWRETRTMPGDVQVTEEFTVLRCDAPSRFVVASPGIGANYRMTYTLTPVEVGRHRGGTAVTVVQEGAPSAPGGRLLALVFGGLAARTVEGALRQDLTDLALAAVRPAAA
ncbi:SRPBCC family protein [Phytohabitans kaempferiae]|uniref:SRPBCC family protein n=1 Tax=Phytohabitans kaempferiae TaxID=1620943 RepID=A0ABV6MG32_9ACTN